jgi:hypothetical protein
MARRRALLGLMGLWTACAPVQGRAIEVASEVHRVELRVDTGSVRVYGAPEGSRVRVLRRARAFPDARKVHQEVTNGVLRIEARCGGALDCRVDHELRVDPKVTVVLQVEDGDVELDGVLGDLDVEVGLGKVTGALLGGHDVEVRTEGGNIDLGFVRAPGRLTANAAAGDVTLRVPGGSYRCDLAAAPPEESGLRCDEAAPATIAASTAVGKLRLRASK